MHSISQNIRSARKAAEKSQKEMAELLKVNRSTYSNWELNTIPDVLTLIKLGEIFNLDWTSLVKETITSALIQPGTYSANPEMEELKDIAKKIKEIAEATLQEVKEIKKMP